MMCLIKKKNAKDVILDKARHKAKINGLSPKQIDELIINNRDVDFLTDEIRDIMENPDVEYLSQLYVPHKIKTVRKPVLADDVTKATIMGDIIGSLHEFTKYDCANAKRLPLFLDTAFYTDDTVLSMATRTAILNNSVHPDFRNEYLTAYKLEPDAGYGASFAAWANDEIAYTDNGRQTHISNNEGYHSYANGAAMRISFIAAYYSDIHDVIKHTIESAMTSHNHIDGVKGTVVLSVCIWMALHDYTKKEILRYGRAHYHYTPKEKELLINNWNLFDIDSELPEFSNEVSKNSLYCNYAVPFVIRCFYDTSDYESCMRKILSYYGDNDTLCAMAGGLCFAYYQSSGYSMSNVLSKYHVKWEE